MDGECVSLPACLQRHETARTAELRESIALMLSLRDAEDPPAPDVPGAFRGTEASGAQEDKENGATTAVSAPLHQRKLPRWMTADGEGAGEESNTSALPYYVHAGPVHYITDVDVANDWVRRIRAHIGTTLMGFDMEWRVVFRKGAEPRKTALIQIAVRLLADEDLGIDIMSVFLFQISAMVEFPEQLKQLLEDPVFVKLGVNIVGDMRRLENDYNVEMRGFKELQMPRTGERKMSLQALTQKYLNYDLLKNKIVRCSDWEFVPLTTEQRHYAAADAAVALLIWETIEREHTAKNVSPFAPKQPATLLPKLTEVDQTTPSPMPMSPPPDWKTTFSSVSSTISSLSQFITSAPFHSSPSRLKRSLPTSSSSPRVKRSLDMAILDSPTQDSIARAVDPSPAHELKESDVDEYLEGAFLEDEYLEDDCMEDEYPEDDCMEDDVPAANFVDDYPTDDDVGAALEDDDLATAIDLAAAMEDGDLVAVMEDGNCDAAELDDADLLDGIDFDDYDLNSF